MDELFKIPGSGIAQFYDLDDPQLAKGDMGDLASIDPDANSDLSSYVEVGEDAFLSGLQDDIVNITVRVDDILWFYIYTRVRDCFERSSPPPPNVVSQSPHDIDQNAICATVGCSKPYSYVDRFQLTPKLQQVIDDFVSANNSAVERALGVHYRAGDMRAACGRGFDPRHYFWYSCFQYTAQEIIQNIKSLQISPSQHIFLATNDQEDSEVLKEFYEHFGRSRIIRLPLEKEFEEYRGILEGWILSRTQTLIGNYYSTFTGNACLRRHYHNCYYFKVWWPSLNIYSRTVALLTAPFLLMLAIMACLYIPSLFRATMLIIVTLKERIHPAALPIGLIQQAEETEQATSLITRAKHASIITCAVIAAVAILIVVLPFEVLFGVTWVLMRWVTCFFTPYCVVPMAVKLIVSFGAIISVIGVAIVCKSGFAAAQVRLAAQTRRGLLQPGSRD
jgi:hypothetical protein